MNALQVGTLISLALLFTTAFCIVWVVLAFLSYQKYKNVNIPVDAAYKVQNSLSALANVNFFVILLCIVLIVQLSELPKFATVTIALSIVILVLAFLSQVFVFLIEFSEALNLILSSATPGQTLAVTGEKLFGQSIYAILAVTIINTILALVIVVYTYRGKRYAVSGKTKSTLDLTEEEQTVTPTTSFAQQPQAVAGQPYGFEALQQRLYSVGPSGTIQYVQPSSGLQGLSPYLLQAVRPQGSVGAVPPTSSFVSTSSPSRYAAGVFSPSRYLQQVGVGAIPS